MNESNITNPLLVKEVVNEGMEIPFQTVTKEPTPLCTWASCPNNHQWVPELAISKCPGCKSPVVAIRLVNCPVCNEPPNQHGLRAEHLRDGGWIGKACLGQKSIGESTFMVLENEVYNKYKVPKQLELDLQEERPHAN